MDQHGIFVSTGGNLQAGHVIHIAAARRRMDWVKVIENCLKEAELRRFAHITFPLLGGGNCPSTAFCDRFFH